MHAARVLAVCTLVVGFAACGSSGGSEGGGGTTTSTKPVDPAIAADRRIAAVAILRPADLPGWTSTERAPSRSGEIKELATGIPGCETFVAGIKDGRVRGRSRKFSKGGTTVDGDVDIYATPAEVQAQLELYRDPAIVTCLQNVLTKALQSSAPAGATVDRVSVSPIAVEDRGEGSYGFRLTASLTNKGTPVTILSEIAGVAVGRIGASLTVTSTDAAELAQAETTLVPILVQRSQDAQT